jgi:tetratricopeptide (TPR) repeat protein
LNQISVFLATKQGQEGLNMSNSNEKQSENVAERTWPQDMERAPVALSILWPVLQLGRSVKRMITSYNDHFNIAPSDLKEIYQKKSQLADERRDTKGSVLFMEKVVTLDPEDHDALYQLGVAYEKNKDLEDAMSTYRKVIESQPDHAKAHYRVGFICLRRREFEEAIKAFEEAQRLEPGSADILFRLGQAFDRLQKHERAVSFFNQAVEIDSDHLPSYKNMALAYDSMNKHKEALACLKRALELEELLD